MLGAAVRLLSAETMKHLFLERAATVGYLRVIVGGAAVRVFSGRKRCSQSSPDWGCVAQTSGDTSPPLLLLGDANRNANGPFQKNREAAGGNLPSVC